MKYGAAFHAGIVNGPAREQLRRNQDNTQRNKVTNQPAMAESDNRGARWHKDQVNAKENGDHPSYSSFLEAQDWKDSPKHCPSEVEIDRDSVKQSALCVELPPAEVEVEQLDCK